MNRFGVRWVAVVAIAATVGAASPARASLAEDPQTNLCTEQLLMGDPHKEPGWNGWGNGPTNTRFQSQAHARLTAPELARLRLQWAFGYANVTNAQPQPTVAGGRLFAPSENGHLYALNPKTGCRYWTYTAQAGIPTAVVLGPYRDAAGNSGFAVYFGDRKANAYAVDAQTGREIWVRKVDTHPAAAITGSLAFDGTRVFVPVDGSSEASACCTFRGSLSALDASTGMVIWKTYTVGESLPRPTEDGSPAFGPAGGGIWSAPALDAKRHLVYVTTGNGYAEPAQSTTDAVLALDINTGDIKWSQQMTPNDALSAPPALTRAGDRDLLLLLQQSGVASALDPDKEGALLWQYCFGQGSGLGVQWGVALDHDQAYVGVADLQAAKPGGLHAVALVDGHASWQKSPQPRLCGIEQGCTSGQGGPLTAIPGAVLNGGMDGGLRAYSSKDGAVLWTFDTNHDFDTVNGVKAHGGSMDSAGPVVVDGMVYVTSGSSGLNGRPGNVLLAFGLP